MLISLTSAHWKVHCKNDKDSAIKQVGEKAPSLIIMVLWDPVLPLVLAVLLF